MTIRLLVLCAALGAGCGPRPVPGAAPMRDSVFVGGTAEVPADLVRDGPLTFAGDARIDTITVGELALLQAETEAQRAAARRAIDAGASLSDPARVLRLFADIGGRATAPTRLDLDRPFVTEAVFRLTPNEGPGLCANTGTCDRIALGFYVVSGPVGDGERRMPSSFAVVLDGSRGDLQNARLLLGIGDDLSSENALTALPAADRDGLAHRLRVAYEPGRVRVVLDGEEILSEAVRLGGPPATLSLSASTGPDGPGAVVTSWRVEQD